MALEQRGARRYYYTKQRLGGRVVSRYEGPEDKTRPLMVERDATRAKREAIKLQSEDWYELTVKLIEIERQACDRIAEHLQSLGYHLHRGQWRKRRE